MQQDVQLQWYGSGMCRHLALRETTLHFVPPAGATAPFWPGALSGRLRLGDNWEGGLDFFEITNFKL